MVTNLSSITLQSTINSVKAKAAAMPQSPVVQQTQQIPQQQNAFVNNIAYYSDTSKIQKKSEKEMFNQIYSGLDREGKKNLEVLLKTGRLLANNSNDKTTTLQNLYKISTEPRMPGLDNQKILKTTIKTLANPFIINQEFEKIPTELVPQIMNDQKLNYVKSMGLQPNQQQNGTISDPSQLNVDASGTCVAASIEFNLADKNPAEYSRYVAGLTSPDLCVKTVVDYADISDNKNEATEILNQFSADYKPINDKQFVVTLRPDRNAIIRARVASTYPQKDHRTALDALMQSTFMQVGSSNNYNSLNDERHGGFNNDDKGLTEYEKTFVESIVENDGAKTSLTYQDVDDNLILKGYTQDFAKTQKQLLDSLKSGKNVIIGITETDETKKIKGGHEITIIGTEQAKNGQLVFIYNDTDDLYAGPQKMAASELIPKIHHAGISNKVLGDQPAA